MCRKIRVGGFASRSKPPGHGVVERFLGAAAARKTRRTDARRAHLSPLWRRFGPDGECARASGRCARTAAAGRGSPASPRTKKSTRRARAPLTVAVARVPRLVQRRFSRNRGRAGWTTGACPAGSTGTAVGRTAPQSGRSRTGRRSSSRSTVTWNCAVRRPRRRRARSRAARASPHARRLKRQPFACSCHTSPRAAPVGRYSPRATSVCGCRPGATSQRRPATCATPRRGRSRSGARGSWARRAACTRSRWPAGACRWRCRAGRPRRCVAQASPPPPDRVDRRAHARVAAARVDRLRARADA